MPNAFENKKIASEAGKKSKRGKAVLTSEIKDKLKGIIDIPKLAEMLDQLEPKDYVRAKIDLLRLLIPKSNDVEMKVTNLSLKDMDNLTHEERLIALKEMGI